MRNKNKPQGFPGGTVDKESPAHAEDTGWVPDPGRPPWCGAMKTVNHNDGARAPGPAGWNCWNSHAKSLCPVTREAISTSSPSAAAERSPGSPQPEKTLSSNEDPVQPKIFF